jgi:hypothetical protein
MATHRTTFQVRGSGTFPFDMLRYDACHPAHEPDSYTLAPQDLGLRVVTLATVHERKAPHLTPDRWASFGWRIVDGSQRTY